MVRNPRDVEAGQETTQGSQRIDKWLWHVRVVKTRTMASTLVTEGKVRIGGSRVDKPGYAVRLGEIVTIVLRNGVRILKVTGFAERRGDTSAASALFEDLAPPAPSAPKAAADATHESGRREPGSGRPTKRDRRLTDRLKGV